MLTLNRKEGESIILTINDQRIKIILSEAKRGPWTSKAFY